MTANTKKTTRPLHNIFTDVPPRYDLINHVFTLGMDTGWRLQAAKACLAGNPRKILDLACGTGDLAVTVAGLAGTTTEVIGLDFSDPMLDIARQKAVNRRQKTKFISGDAANLPFPNNHFDCVGISFAFRNLTYKHAMAGKHISEVLRVLKPGGRFVIVESSQPKNKIIRAIDHFYLRTFVYRIGWWISGNRNAFNYLTLSASRYYSAEELETLLLGSGFKKVSFRRLFFGAAAIHIAVK